MSQAAQGGARQETSSKSTKEAASEKKQALGCFQAALPQTAQDTAIAQLVSGLEGLRTVF